jgi:hypothetical protein
MHQRILPLMTLISGYAIAKKNSPIGFQENIHIAYMSDECGRTSCVDDTGHGGFAM